MNKPVKQLELLVEEQALLEKHSVATAVTGSLKCVQKNLSLPLEQRDYSLMKGEIGHCYLLIGAIEHQEHRRFEQTRRVVDYYKNQIYETKKHR